MRWPDEVESPERVSGERRGSGTRNDTETDRDENGQRDAGREAPMGALRSPALGLDAEPRPLDGGFCLAVRMASSGRPGPGGLDEILQSGAPWHARTDMLEHAQSAPGRSTRFTSARPRAGSSTLQNTSPLSTVSKLWSRNGSASARARTRGTVGARRRARLSAPSDGSTATALEPRGSNGRLRPVPVPRSSTRP